MSAEIIPFRRKPATPQVNPIMEATAAYLIGFAIAGLTVMAVVDAFWDGGDTRRRR